MKWYAMEVDAVLSQLQTNRIEGLSSDSVRARLDADGPNVFQETEKPAAWKLLLGSLKEPIIIILLVAILLATLSSLYDFMISKDIAHGMASLYEAIAILIIIMVNAGLTFYQTQSAEKSLAALKEMRQHQVKVLRDGQWQEIKTTELVAGDIISVKTGDFIEGDVRFIKTAELQINESQLTGEADAIDKQTAVLADDVDLADHTNMGFSGSMVVSGNGIGVVVATGMQTELGKIANLMQEAKVMKTPIEKSVSDLGRKIMMFAGFIVVFTIGYDVMKQYLNSGGLTMAEMANTLSAAIAIAVASIPDAMPVVLSIVLTIGAKMLAKNKGLIKSLSSVETLGATTYIASDKTGTLTKNEMTVTRFYTNNQVFDVEGVGYTPIGEILDERKQLVALKHYLRLFEIAVLNNEAEIKVDENGNYRPFGNPTDVSLVVMAAKKGITRDQLMEKDTEDIEVIRILPFDSTRKMMTVVIKENGRYYSLTKGAPDVIEPRSTKALIDNQVVDYGQVQMKAANTVIQFAQEALRTIALTQREISYEMAMHATVAELEKELCFVGLVGIIDPPREEVTRSIEKLTNANVKVVMITGDHALTAQAIAQRLGIINDLTAPVVEGKEIETMTDADLKEVVQKTRVYARVSPEHKQRIVKQLQANEEVVAMTGDGINDAPALKAADIGIAMGINGTEVTKDAADLILLDDKFTTIEASVETGRTIYGNILNFIRQELVTNVSEVLSLILGVVLITSPINQVSDTAPTLTALMVLWVNMISDSLPSFAMGYDEPEKNMMHQEPRNIKHSILANGMLARVMTRGISMGTLVFLGFVWAAFQGYTTAESQTVAFLLLVFGQLWHVYDARSVNTIFDRNPFSNSRLTLAVAFAATSSVLATLIPMFNRVIGTAPLSFNMYLAILVISSVPTFLISGIKKLIRK